MPFPQLVCSLTTSQIFLKADHVKHPDAPQLPLAAGQSAGCRPNGPPFHQLSPRMWLCPHAELPASMMLCVCVCVWLPGASFLPSGTHLRAVPLSHDPHSSAWPPRKPADTALPTSCVGGPPRGLVPTPQWVNTPGFSVCLSANVATHRSPCQHTLGMFV